MTHLIGITWQAGAGAPMTSQNPATGEVLWQGNGASAEQVSAAVAAARAACVGWATTPLEDRIAVAERYSALLANKKNDLADLIAREAGKVMWDALGEATAMINKIAISVKSYHERTGTKAGEAGVMRTRITHRPHGVMAVFGPYNFPGHLPNGHIVPALIAGNVVVFKPSELTPAVAELMVKTWREAGLPDGVLNQRLSRVMWWCLSQAS